MKEFSAKVINLDEAFFVTLELTDDKENAVKYFHDFKEAQANGEDQTETMIEYIKSEEIVEPLTDAEREVLVDGDAGFWYKVDPDCRSNII